MNPKNKKTIIFYRNIYSYSIPEVTKGRRPRPQYIDTHMKDRLAATKLEPRAASVIGQISSSLVTEASAGTRMDPHRHNWLKTNALAARYLLFTERYGM